MSDVEEMWAAHVAEPFPAAARGEEVNGIDLVYLDSSAAGAVVSALGGSPDPALLRLLLAELSSVTQELLPGETDTYFRRLQEIVATLVDA